MATLFSKIISGEIPGKIIYKDERCAALVDIKPEAPKHFLVVPLKEIPSLADAQAHDEATLGHLLLVAAKVAEEQGLAKSGYRVVINVGEDAGQSVDHLHVHVLGGRRLNWPPG